MRALNNSIRRVTLTLNITQLGRKQTGASLLLSLVNRLNLTLQFAHVNLGRRFLSRRSLILGLSVSDQLVAAAHRLHRLRRAACTGDSVVTDRLVNGLHAVLRLSHRLLERAVVAVREHVRLLA